MFNVASAPDGVLEVKIDFERRDTWESTSQTSRLSVGKIYNMRSARCHTINKISWGLVIYTGQAREAID